MPPWHRSSNEILIIKLFRSKHAHKDKQTNRQTHQHKLLSIKQLDYHAHTYAHARAQAHTRAHTHTHTHAHMHARERTRAHTHTQVHIHMHTHKQTYKHISQSLSSKITKSRVLKFFDQKNKKICIFFVLRLVEFTYTHIHINKHTNTHHCHHRTRLPRLDFVMQTNSGYTRSWTHTLSHKHNKHQMAKTRRQSF